MIDDPKLTQDNSDEENLPENENLDEGGSAVPTEEAAVQDADDAAEATETEEPAETPESAVEAEKDQAEAEAAQEQINSDVTAEDSLAATLNNEEPDEKLEQAKQVLNASDPDTAKWYIVHTYSGHENKVAKSIKQRVQSLGFENRIFDIIVPTRNTVKVSGGKKETVKEKIFPGYVLVKMALDDESWLLIRTTQGVTAFIGAGNKPTPISEKEVEAIQKFMNEEEPLYKSAFTVGEAVKIVDGPFADFLGTIDNIDEPKGKLKVLVSIFGRETPVELDFLQVNKL